MKQLTLMRVKASTQVIREEEIVPFNRTEDMLFETRGSGDFKDKALYLPLGEGITDYVVGIDNEGFAVLLRLKKS